MLKLTIKKCGRCKRYYQYSTNVCFYCKNLGLEDVYVDGIGTLKSWTDIHVAPNEDTKTPYRIGIIQLKNSLNISVKITPFEENVLINDKYKCVQFRDQLPIFEKV